MSEVIRTCMVAAVMSDEGSTSECDDDGMMTTMKKIGRNVLPIFENDCPRHCSFSGWMGSVVQEAIGRGNKGLTMCEELWTNGEKSRTG